jgi:hypothetical protein
MPLLNGLGKRQASLFGWIRTSISEPYAAEIRAGRYLPHPRHWQTLARLVGVMPDQ